MTTLKYKKDIYYRSWIQQKAIFMNNDQQILKSRQNGQFFYKTQFMITDSTSIGKIRITLFNF